MSDPNDPPAIVRPADFADRLTGLLAEAQAFGRKTLEAKIAAGRKLNEAFAEWQKRAEADPKCVPWKKLVKRFGYSERTERRLRTAARSRDAAKLAANLLKSQVPEFDAIYDDGLDPEAVEGKNPCRECRIKGKLFDPKCAACRALNRALPKPKDDGPPKDLDGNLIPAHLVDIFREGELLRELTNYLTTGQQAIKGLAERPAMAAVRFEELEKRLKSLKAYALFQRPGYVHLDCDGKGCQGCHGGWRTIIEVKDERAAVANAANREKAKAWREKQARRNDHIPE